jgi:hypothetical protein
MTSSLLQVSYNYDFNGNEQSIHDIADFVNLSVSVTKKVRSLLRSHKATSY